MLLLGFSAGLPLLLVFGSLSFWLREAGIDSTTIGYLSWIGLAYGFKWVWAPLVDRLPIPLLTRWLGRRRSWLLLSQCVIIAALVGMALTDPQQALLPMVWCALAVAVGSATQDIALDAFRIESADTQRQAALAEARQLRGPADHPEDRNLWERCLTRGLPTAMLPQVYNNNYQIVQTTDHVVILAEMIHDARVIPLDGRPHLPAHLRAWMGDSVGRWDGDTLVVETTNFTDKTKYRGSTDQLRLVERFTRTAQDILTYRVTVHDPSTFTQPWTIELPVRRSDGEIYEYACHEANYGLEGILRGHRAEERVAAEAAAKKSPK